MRCAPRSCGSWATGSTWWSSSRASTRRATRCCGRCGPGRWSRAAAFARSTTTWSSPGRSGRGSRSWSALGRAWSALAGAALAVPFAMGTAAGSTPDGEVVCRLLDPQIIESSGLVVAGDLLVTTNDSGDTGRVFAVDPDTGETVGVTTWSDDPTDVEALAPAGEDAVWVGDIGDNPASRKSIEVTRVPVGRSDRDVDEETYDLAYPGGPVDAESLLSDP